MSATTFDLLRTIVAATVARPADALSETTPVAELRLTSLDVVEIAADVEDAFGVSVPEDALRAAVTLGDIVKVIDKVREGSA